MLQFLRDNQTGTDLVAVVLHKQQLMLVLHDDTVATYEVRPLEDRYTVIDPIWPDTPEEFRQRIFAWGERVKVKADAGVSTIFAGA